MRVSQLIEKLKKFPPALDVECQVTPHTSAEIKDVQIVGTTEYNISDRKANGEPIIKIQDNRKYVIIIVTE